LKQFGRLSKGHQKRCSERVLKALAGRQLLDKRKHDREFLLRAWCAKLPENDGCEHV